MNRFKIIATILIISFGLISSYFILRNSAQTISPKGQLNNQQSYNEQLNESLPGKPLQSGDNNLLSDNQNNLTQTLTQGIFEQVKSADFSNQANAGPLPDINSLTAGGFNDLFKKNLSDLNLISDIDTASLKISQDNSQKAKSGYLDAIGAINKKDANNINKSYLTILVDVFQKLNYSSAVQMADVYKNLASDYSNITVPSDWLNVHKNLIIYFKNSETVYRALANYPQDPVKGYLALQMIDQVVINKGQVLERLLSEKAKTIGRY